MTWRDGIAGNEASDSMAREGGKSGFVSHYILMTWHDGIAGNELWS